MMTGRFVSWQKVRAARAFGAHGCLGEFLLEALEAAEFLVDGRPEDTRRLPAAAFSRRCEVCPEEAVQQVPADVKGKLLEGCLHVEVAAGLAALLELLEDGIGSGHIGLVVFFMVELQLLFGDVRRQILVTVGQFW
jgi:hypothetical protein